MANTTAESHLDNTEGNIATYSKPHQVMRVIDTLEQTFAHSYTVLCVFI